MYKRFLFLLILFSFYNSFEIYAEGEVQEKKSISMRINAFFSRNQEVFGGILAVTGIVGFVSLMIYLSRNYAMSRSERQQQACRDFVVQLLKTINPGPVDFVKCEELVKAVMHMFDNYYCYHTHHYHHYKPSDYNDDSVKY